MSGPRRIIDDWVGGSSPVVQFHYRVVKLEDGKYDLECCRVGDAHGTYVSVMSDFSHRVARRIMELLHEDYDAQEIQSRLGERRRA